MLKSPIYQSENENHYFEIIPEGVANPSIYTFAFSSLFFKFNIWEEVKEASISISNLERGAEGIADFIQSIPLPINAPESGDYRFLCRTMNVLAIAENGKDIRLLDKYDNVLFRLSANECRDDPSTGLAFIYAFVMK
ncbi:MULTISPECIES: hypothetical protein [Vibrio]|uniref:Uncharacterized protein n=1 Tax=Vibrio tasmaniensis TaxID=212663 RepID=A0A2N7ND09_9VIBR|nr:hypothetical protein [Vibrio tasmaniensis]PMO89834.1 hypothetical protein BCT01_00705 [Vibrio tasmaniensis]PMP09993.1 hypothetical protein BCS92_02385 [Vibrio tasmaniensis]TKG32623.1 hypothetical protein FC057_12465 [Vibrio tasmaniensis]TKG41693.1 hypothetical protein FC063_07475 [Vibrio tasmaniensis]TKG52048.1 hypothetical protein FC070_09745 [Vibrio tasmaniensis]